MKASPEKTRNTVYAVGIGAELVARTVLELVGNDISDSLNKQPVNTQVIGQIAAARFQTTLQLNK